MGTGVYDGVSGKILLKNNCTNQIYLLLLPEHLGKNKTLIAVEDVLENPQENACWLQQYKN
jgi:hypothetical protein